MVRASKSKRVGCNSSLALKVNHTVVDLIFSQNHAKVITAKIYTNLTTTKVKNFNLSKTQITREWSRLKTKIWQQQKGDHS